MKIFELETPITKKIKSFVDQAITDEIIPTGQIINYYDYEPDDGFIHDREMDGAVAVYARQIDFPPGKGSTTDTQGTDDLMIVDCYGFGDPVPEEETPTLRGNSVKQAQLRGQVLTTLAYKAIMDRQEIQGSATVDKDFGSAVDFGADKFPVSIVKYSPQGAITSRGTCIYRSTYKFEIEESVPEEPLGIPYAGTENLESPTYNPGDEPEGV